MTQLWADELKPNKTIVITMYSVVSHDNYNSEDVTHVYCSHNTAKYGWQLPFYFL